MSNDDTPVLGTTALRQSFSYLPGLDGLRGLAVLAVIAYHAQQNMPSSWMPGGFVGVEVFFVISGYLITSLLVVEHENTGRISLGRFWARRARRLLPALFALLVVTMGIVGFGGAVNDSLREHVRAFRGMWVSAWLYFTNWFQIIAGLSYTDSTGRPPLLRHLWSLAVEEQFYLVWPLVMWWVLRRFAKHLRAVGAVFVALAVAITVVVAAVYQSDNLWRTNFLYLSTPTRLPGLLLGAAAAIFWQPWRWRDPTSPRRLRAVDGIALAGLAVIVWSALTWHVTTEDIYGPRGYDLLFRGGLLIVAVASLAVVMAAAHPTSFVGRRVLSLRPLVWVGKRSYGLYLWHWPVFQLTRPRGDQSLLDSTNPDIGWAWFPTLLLRIAITLVVTELSYRLLELPVRNGLGFVRSRALAGAAAVSLLVTAVPVSSSFAAVDEIAVQARCNRNPEECPYLREDESVEGLEPIDTTPVDTSTPDSTPVDTSAPDTSAPAAVTPTSTTVSDGAPAASVQTVPAMAVAPLAIGDSVMLGAEKKLEAAGIRVDAREGRRFGRADGLIDAYRAAGQIGDVVILALGSNDNLSARLIDRILDKLVDVPHVIVLTPQVNGRNNEARNQRLLLEAGERYPNVTVLDWRRLAQPKLRFYWRGPYVKKASQAYFWRDKIHLAPAGQRYYTALIVEAVTEAVTGARGSGVSASTSVP